MLVTGMDNTDIATSSSLSDKKHISLPANELITDKKLAAMEKAGATRERAYKAMVDGLEANTIVVDKYGEEHIYPDTASRLRASELITKAHGDWKDGPTIVNAQVNIGVSPQELKTLLDMVSVVNTELAGLRGSGRQTGRIIDV